MKSFFPMLAAALLLSAGSSAQSFFAVGNTSFSKAFETVLMDYPNNFHNISGELLISQGEYEHYASTVQLPGALSCVVGRYHSMDDSTASWQAVMFRCEEFPEAEAEYKKLYRQLKASPITVVDGSKFYLQGDLQEASESMDFNITTLVFGTADRRYEDFKVELELLNDIEGWVININMVRRKPDDSMEF